MQIEKKMTVDLYSDGLVTNTPIDLSAWELDELTENNPALFSEVPEDDIRLLQHLIDDNIMRGHPDEKKFSIYKYADVFDDAATEKVVCIKYISTITYKDV